MATTFPSKQIAKLTGHNGMHINFVLILGSCNPQTVYASHILTSMYRSSPCGNLLGRLSAIHPHRLYRSPDPPLQTCPCSHQSYHRGKGQFLYYLFLHTSAENENGTSRRGIGTDILGAWV